MKKNCSGFMHSILILNMKQSITEQIAADEFTLNDNFNVYKKSNLCV